MERAFLKGLELESDTIDAIMAEHGTNVQRLKEQADNLTSQLAQKDAEIQKLNEALTGMSDYAEVKANNEAYAQQNAELNERC